eukprot:19785-Chlamydomonas_euryale.AAC.1
MLRASPARPHLVVGDFNWVRTRLGIGGAWGARSRPGVNRRQRPGAGWRRASKTSFAASNRRVRAG